MRVLFGSAGLQGNNGHYLPNTSFDEGSIHSRRQGPRLASLGERNLMLSEPVSPGGSGGSDPLNKVPKEMLGLNPELVDKHGLINMTNAESIWSNYCSRFAGFRIYEMASILVGFTFGQKNWQLINDEFSHCICQKSLRDFAESFINKGLRPTTMTRLEKIAVVRKIATELAMNFDNAYPQTFPSTVARAADLLNAVKNTKLSGPNQAIKDVPPELLTAYPEILLDNLAIKADDSGNALWRFVHSYALDLESILRQVSIFTAYARRDTQVSNITENPLPDESPEREDFARRFIFEDEKHNAMTRDQKSQIVTYLVAGFITYATARDAGCEPKYLAEEVSPELFSSTLTRLRRISNSD